MRLMLVSAALTAETPGLLLKVGADITATLLGPAARERARIFKVY